MNLKIRLYLTVTLLFLALTVPAFANKLPENHAVNGGVTIIPIEAQQKPEALYHNKRIPVIPGENKNEWLLVVGIPLENTQSVQYITLKEPARTNIPFHISDKYYKTQSLTIDNKRKVDPNDKDQIQIEAENKKLAEIFARYTPTNPFSEEFKAPSQGPVSSLFGLKRVYNQQPRAPHSGLDIASPANSPVHVISGGTVVDTSPYFFTGNTVIVDHGMGVFSLYGHLKEVTVHPGETLKKGDIVGTVGMTGRATGPHLHWSMIVNQTLVDPLLFVPVNAIPPLPPAKKIEKVAKHAQ